MNNSYCPVKLQDKETSIVKGEFEFTGYIVHPYAFKLGIKINSKWKYLSDNFFVEPGEQKVTCNIDSLRELPVIENSMMATFTPSFILAPAELIRQFKGSKLKFQMGAYRVCKTYLLTG